MSEYKVRRLLQRLFPPKRTAILFSLLLIAGIVLVWIISPLLRLSKTYGIGPTFVSNIVSSDPPPLNSAKNRTNILIMGIAGGDHEGSDLTDSLMVASISLAKDDIAFISLPRDIWSPTLQDKINSAYHYGEEKKPGGGLVLAKSIMEEVLGIPIHYSVLADFAGFTKIIDTLGGIDIFVEKGFTDTEFPIAGKENDLCDGDTTYACRYRSITFSQGIGHMNGEQALEFVRSRHAEGSEGNDFARNRRQQNVLLAIKDKLVKDKLYLDIGRMQTIMQQVDKATKTDLSIAEMFYLAKLGKTIDSVEIRRIPLEEEVENGKSTSFLINPPAWQYGGRWILVPKDKDFSKIHEYVNCKLTDQACSLTLPQPSP